MITKVFYRFQYRFNPDGSSEGVCPSTITRGSVVLAHDAEAPTEQSVLGLPPLSLPNQKFGTVASDIYFRPLHLLCVAFPRGYSVWRRYKKTTPEKGEKKSPLTGVIYAPGTQGADYPGVGWVPDCELDGLNNGYYHARDGQWRKRTGTELRYANERGPTAYEIPESQKGDLVAVMIAGFLYLTEPENCFAAISSDGRGGPAHTCEAEQFVLFRGYRYRRDTFVAVEGESVTCPQGYLMTSSAHVMCPRCRRWHTREAFGIHSSGYCPRCVRETTRSRVILDYSNRNYPAPLGKGILMYGVEAETEVHEKPVSEAAFDVQDALGSDFVILKRDGSLSNGFEIVTAPATLDEHRKHWPPLERVRGSLRAWDTSTCGMHVHISREALSPLQLGRLVVFINSPANKEFISRVAGRYGNSYAAMRSSAKITDSHRVTGSRHVAVNLSNEKTVEIRIFRGTVCPQHIIRNLEFVDALVHFCWPSERSIADTTSHKAFCEYVDANRSLWPLFHRWLGAKGYVKPTVDTKKFKRPALEEVS